MEVTQNNIYARHHLIKTRELTKGLAFCIFILVVIAAKFLILKILPSKYLFDSNHIIDICNGANGYGDKAYEFTASIFTPLVKLLHINNAKTGSIILGVILNPILLLVMYKKLPWNINFIDCILISLLLLLLLNVYVFNVSKDLVQFVIDLIALFFIKKIKNQRIQTLLVSLTFILFSFVFRSYLAIIGILYLYIKSFNNKHIDKKVFLLFTACLFIVITAYLFYCNNFLFNSIFNNRDNTNKYRLDSENAQTIINNLINKDGYIFEIINYIINLIRLIFPIELILRGNILYLLFLIFNILTFITIYLQRDKIKKDSVLNSIFTLFISFIFVFALFEPDFGSFLRHFIPIAFIMVIVCLYLPIKKNQCINKINIRI